MGTTRAITQTYVAWTVPRLFEVGRSETALESYIPSGGTTQHGPRYDDCLVKRDRCKDEPFTLEESERSEAGYNDCFPSWET